MIQDKENDWFTEFKKGEEYKAFLKNPVAYFCAEYALESTLPTYAGGLGVLAGDLVREVALQKFPLISVGLFYKKGQNILSTEKILPKNKLKPVLDESGKEVIVSLPMENRPVKVRAWQWEDGGARVYLLDTDIPENRAEDRKITEQLYNEDRDMRLRQEILLGIAGFRLLAQLGYHPSVYHLNEGHSAFLALELIKHEMEHQQVDFKEACEYAKKHIVFTNHTLLMSGQERFSSDKVKLFIDPCAKEICLNQNEIAELGTLENNPDTFSMTNFSFKLSTKSNAVSRLHQEKSIEIWPNKNIENVTNGIFISRWDKVDGVSEKNIWATHLKNKKKLLDFIREKTGEIWNETDLIFVWARRLVEYKQPLFFLDNIEKLLEISKNSPIPIRIVFSGPITTEDNPFVLEIKKIIKEKLKGIVVFIPDYNTDIAEILTSGADIWLNTPMVGFEACGTSGMKAGLNGVLALSTQDGWVYEVEEEDIGWVINDSQNSEEIFTLVKEKIIPIYYAHLKNLQNSMWLKKMMRARNLILENFSTSRVLREYIEKLYIPIMKQKHTHKID
ncbi:hypothetical protein A2641_00870 [Candidatus Nomurabacteria bacterium RIFCSPHIGHO2_01_FULL_37_25]|uniref:glycogen phosphorylase n=1 Tax=Candidatus Nomurabacteria bacterium RIFCSPLOWO2_01_FULL_36_16 TaxID=1801767 RepID=A0A1F6WXR7_9BACT|nr:MAG: hypothetical protein A2641_00870 [Candidatus Nomurabacteria bacterium RIFCSPHIGHO2_01_FULL_37_25]OGI74947.1 MAG: hypothetical protein A3D36_01475 [Candidatus Nomurabacteria bacterium RIFCSPHIGHO2_02_FULL_36_29]OGI86660.1 MAG: hypothetical protein A3A91_03040 [Candidatus Nomurabacteria bacterium RIFCSPLOWO2_01_FULL_36_16]